MSNLIFSLNSTLPIFLVMMLGFVFRKTGRMSESFASEMNSFVFKIALPVNLFVQLHDVAFQEIWDSTYILYCVLVTIASGFIAWLLSHLLKDRAGRGEFIQGSFRSSASLLALSYIEMIYGSSTIGPLMIIGCVPAYNIMAVIALSGDGSGKTRLDAATIKKTVIGILKVPIVQAILLGFFWALLKLPFPKILLTTSSYIGRLASPLGLLAMGALLELDSIQEKLKPVAGATFLKLLGFAALFLPVAILLGFRDEKLVASLVMLGSASTVSGYIMAVNMGHKGSIASGTVALSTLLSSFSMTFWIWLLRTMGMI
ncbi:MAG: AEC family transporter [Lachnospiraceae bacterium]|nr:AEC family transporter [Lachnospiraceae bacterium]